MTVNPEIFVEMCPGYGPLDLIGQTYLQMPGTTSSGPSTPNSTSYDSLTNLDLRIDIDGYLVNNATLISKWTGSGPGSTTTARSFIFWAYGDTISFAFTTDGTLSASSNVVTVPFEHDPPVNQRYATIPIIGRRVLRAVFEGDNGLGGFTATYYTGETLDGPWTQLGFPYENTTFGAVTINTSTSPLIIGEGTTPEQATTFNGRIFGARVYAGTNGDLLLAEADFESLAAGTTSFTDDTGKAWTITGGSELISAEWEDISEHTIGASWGYGRNDELEHFPAGEATIVLYNDDRRFDPQYAAGPYYGELVPRVPVRIRSQSLGMSNVSLGTLNAGTPDHASYSMSDIDVRVHCALDDYTPTTFGRYFVTQYATSDISWGFGIHTDGSPLFIYSTDGSTAVTVTASATVSVSDQEPIWLRCAFDSDVGGVSNQTYFYKSNDGETWTQIGATQTHTGAVALFDSSTSLSVGAILSPGGYFYEVDLRSGIDSNTSVANPVFTAQAVGATTFTDSQSRVWTMANSASFEYNSRYKLDQFYGYVENGWEQDLYPPEGANCTIRLVDRLGALSGYVLTDVFDYDVIRNEPTGYWVLNGPSGTEEVADQVFPPHDATVEGSLVTFGEAPVAPGHYTSCRFSATDTLGTTVFGRVTCSPNPICTQAVTDRSVMVTFRASATSPLNFSTIFVENDGFEDSTGISIVIDDDGTLKTSWFYQGAGIGFPSDVSVVDGDGHIVIGASFGLYLDTYGVAAASAGAPFVPGGRGVGIGGLNGTQNVDHFNGWIGSVALFDKDLSVGQINLFTTRFNKLNGERSDQQILWALDQVGIATSEMNLDEGTITMGVVNAGGRDVLEWIREVTATEGGGFYIDHRDGGKFRFTNRYARYTDARSVTAQAVFSDDPDATFYNVTRVERGGVEIAPNGIDGVTNQVTAEWSGGELVASDTTSIQQYGPRARQLKTQATAAAIARSAADWFLAKHSEPRFRVKQLSIYPAAAKTAFKPALNLKIDDRVTYRSHPQMVGDAIETDLFVDGVQHTVERGVDWKTTFQFAQADVFDPWVWGSDAWDVGTYWG